MELLHKLWEWWDDHIHPGQVFLLVLASFSTMVGIAYTWFKYILKSKKVFQRKLDFLIKAVVSVEKMLIQLLKDHRK